MKYYIIKSAQETVNYDPNSIKYKYVKQNPRITKRNGQINFYSEWLYICRQNKILVEILKT